jgi:hypothetical protein
LIIDDFVSPQVSTVLLTHHQQHQQQQQAQQQSHHSLASAMASVSSLQVSIPFIDVSAK